MEIEIYLDVLFFMNLVMNLWILTLLKQRFSTETKGCRIWAAAGLGATVYIGLFLIPCIPAHTLVHASVQAQGEATLQTTVSILLQLSAVALSVPAMCRILLPSRKKHLWKKVTLQGFIYSFVIAGILRAVLYKWQLFTGREISFFAVLLGAYVCMQIGCFCIRSVTRHGKKSICHATIISSGTQTRVKALLDTGNSLLEPISRKPVCLIEEELLARITLENPLYYRAIPFHSIGCKQGILYGVEIPKLTIMTEEQSYTATNVVCAAVPGKLSNQKKYQMILHPALCTEET